MQWEDQHEGLTCEQFAQWKADNDATSQQHGLNRHLDLHGIGGDCFFCFFIFCGKILCFDFNGARCKYVRVFFLCWKVKDIFKFLFISVSFHHYILPLQDCQ